MKIHNLKLFVESLLKRDKITKDDDIELIIKVCGMEKPEHRNLFNYLGQLMKEGNLSMPESIKRQRQRLQQKNPDLRGERYKERQEKGGQ